jgi:hypothetical protein
MQIAPAFESRVVRANMSLLRWLPWNAVASSGSGFANLGAVRMNLAMLTLTNRYQI